MSAIINNHRRTTKHVPEVDLMKALAIVSMVLIHAQMASPGLIIRNQAESFLNDLINFFGCIPSAVVFMTALGWGASFSVHSTPGTYMKRALHLVIPGIAVNFLTHYLPALLVPAVFGPLSEVLPAILAADVYFFAALSMLCLAALKKLSGEGKDRITAVSAAALVVVCFALNILLGHENFTLGNAWLDTLLGLFIRENAWSYFPFISWIVYPMLGYGLAVLYRRARSQSQVLLFAGLTGAISILLSQFLLNRLGLEDSMLTNCTGCTDGASRVRPGRVRHHGAGICAGLRGHSPVSRENSPVCEFLKPECHGNLHPAVYTDLPACPAAGPDREHLGQHGRGYPDAHRHLLRDQRVQQAEEDKIEEKWVNIG